VLPPCASGVEAAGGRRPVAVGLPSRGDRTGGRAADARGDARTPPRPSAR